MVELYRFVTAKGPLDFVATSARSASDRMDAKDEDEELEHEELEARARTAQRVAFLAKLRKKKKAVERAQITSEIYGEQPFLPGVDKGLKIWIKVREQMRCAETGGDHLPMTYPTRIKYDNRWYWMDETHKEWKDMIRESIQEKEESEQFVEITELIAEDILKEIIDHESARFVFLEQETEEDREKREIMEKMDAAISSEELSLMTSADTESGVIEYTLRAWAQEEAAEALSRITTAKEEEEKIEYYDDGTKVRYNEDGSRKEDRGVYGILPLLDPKLPKRTPGLTLAEFMHHWKYSNDKPATLLLAFQHFHWKYMELMLDAAGPQAQSLLNMPINTKTQRTLLHLSVLGGDAERVKWLLDRGANPLVVDHRGDTPLHLSIDHEVFLQYHDVAIAADLLESRVKNKVKASKMSFKLVNMPNHRGVTVLHRAILLGALEYVELFLKSKANVYVFDNNHVLPIQYAKEEWEHEVKDLYSKNVRFCGKRMHQEMWSYLMSREFVKSIFTIVAPICRICQRKQYDCASLKKKDFRYWLYAHELAKKSSKK